jgi:hypothetical protein
MALFDPRDFGGDAQGWLSGAFQSLPQMDIAPNAGWGDPVMPPAPRRTGRPTAEALDEWFQTPGMQAPLSPFDAPGQSYGMTMPPPGMAPQAPQMAPQAAPLPMPPQGPQMPPSAMLDAAMVPPAAPPPAPSSRPVPAYIARVSQQYGLDPQMMQRFAQIESGGNPQNVTGSYKGLFQLSEEEFRKYGGGNIFNAEHNAQAAARKLATESAEFEAKYGRKPSATDLYLTHQQGPAGYEAHMTNPNRPAWQSMLSTGEGRERGEKWAKAAIWGNVPDQYKRQFGSVDNITSAQFVDLWRTKVEGGSAMPLNAQLAVGGGGNVTGGGGPARNNLEPITIGGVVPQGQPISIGDRIQAAGAGFFNAGSPMQAIGNLIGGAITGQRQDPTGIAAQIYNQNREQVAMSQGAAMDYVAQDPSIPKPMKMAMLQNPALAAEYVKGLMKPADYKYEKIGPGDSLVATSSRSPGAIPIIQGGIKPGEVADLRKEISSLDQVKSYGKALPVFRSMVESNNAAVKDPGKSAVDIDFVYGLAKIFDPDSVVREGEMLLVKKLQSLPEELRGYIQKINTGNGLTPEVRQRILEIARTRMGELKGSVDERLTTYKGIAERNKINLDDILPAFQDLPDLPKSAPAASGWSVRKL